MLKTLSRRELENALKLAISSVPPAAASDGVATAGCGLNETLHALSLAPRVKIIDFLRDGPRMALEISAAIGGPRANFSRHLRHLADAGLITIEISPHDARQRIVSLRTEPFDALGAWVDALRSDRQRSDEV